MEKVGELFRFCSLSYMMSLFVLLAWICCFIGDLLHLPFIIPASLDIALKTTMSKIFIFRYSCPSSRFMSSNAEYLETVCVLETSTWDSDIDVRFTGFLDKLPFIISPSTYRTQGRSKDFSLRCR